jgi:hypothetical protein
MNADFIPRIGTRKSGKEERDMKELAKAFGGLIGTIL